MCTLGLCVVCCDDGAGAVCLGRCCIVHHALLKYVKNPKLNYNLDSRKSIINYNEVKKINDNLCECSRQRVSTATLERRPGHHSNHVGVRPSFSVSF
jgi:hypothetical protein